MRKRILWGGATLAVVALAAIYLKAIDDEWPEHKITDVMKTTAKKENDKYREAGIDYKRRFQDYSTTGDYLNFAETKTNWVGKRSKLDGRGLPKIKYGKEYYYNPVTLSQYALSEYGRALKDGEYSQFNIAIGKLLSMQSADGAFRYNFHFRHYTNKSAYEEGWVSGMAQGQVLSVLARKYMMDGGEEIREAGNTALDFLRVPASEGGPFTTLKDLDESLSDYIFFQEYVTDPNVYTLNGFMFTLLGLYDWHKATGSDDAWELYTGGLDTLEKILPYYDLGHLSAYDLSYITHNRKKPHLSAGYHAIHIQLLKALYSVTINQSVKKHMEMWIEDIS